MVMSDHTRQGICGSSDRDPTYWGFPRMTCQQLTDFIVDYRSGALSPDVRTQFDAHLAACTDCVAYLKSYEETIRLARGAYGQADDPIPADVPEKLVQAVLATRRKRLG
jgi:anti-sigma factor RsiW